MKSKVVLDGGDELIKTLRQLGNGVRKEASVEALTDACEIIEEDARRRVPVRRGKLRDSIGYIVGGGSRTQQFKSYRPRVGEAFVATTMGHSTLQEYGTVHHPAQPFLTPAMEYNRDAVERAMALVLKEYLDRWKAR